MTLETNAFTSYDAVGNREDLSDVIYNIAPTDTPFLSRIAKVNAKAVLHEWQTDDLASAGANAVLEGDAATVDAATATVRLSNTCQISDKVPRVTGTQMAVNAAGRADELAYQVVKRAKELKRDMEFALLDNNAEVTGDATTARELGGIEAWLETNTSHGDTGSAGTVGNTARTGGTDRTITEALVKTQLANIWTEGGNPDVIMVPGTIKQTISTTFTGNATRMINAQDKELVSTIDIYTSDFGDLEVIANRFMEDDSCLILQMDMFAVAQLRAPSMVRLSKTGDTEMRQLIAEYTLVSRNEKASGAVFDVDA